jgi:hypothetical protein
MVGGLAAIGAARRYYRNWGSTKDECLMSLPGDEVVAAPSTRLTDAVSIERCAADVWPWLLARLDRAGGPWNTGETSQARRLAPGDVIRLTPRGWLGLPNGVALVVTELVDGQAIVLRAGPPDLPWTVVWSFHLLPRGADRCRLVVRTRIALRHPGQVVLTEAAGLLVTVMTRGVLLGIRRSAQSQRASRAPSKGVRDDVLAESRDDANVN